MQTHSLLLVNYSTNSYFISVSLYTLSTSCYDYNSNYFFVFIVEATEPIAKVQPPILENPKEEEPKKSNKSEEKSKNNNKNSKTEEVNNIEDTHYEEVMIHGMSVSENGFCVLLKGLISDRLIKIPVTPADPMSDGLDRVEVDSSEAVTLLQLLQGIDVESFLPADALANKFNSVAISDSKHIYSLKRVIIDNVTTAEKGFKSKLCGASSRSEEVTVNVSSNSITANGGISREVVSSSVVETPKQSLQNTETEYLSDTIEVTRPTQGTVLESDVSSTPNPTIDVKEPKRNDYSNPELASSPVINRMDNNLDSVLPLDGTNLYTTEIPIDVEGTETAVEADSLNNYPTMSGVTGVSSTVKSVDNSSKEVNTASVVIDPVNRITATTVTDPNSGEVISTVGNGSNGSLIRTTRSAVEVEVASAFEAIALALRHRAVIEVRSELLSDDNLSYTMDELKAYFPKLLEASRASDITETISTNSDINDRLFEIERLQRRLAEATRQQKEIKIEEIKRQLQWVNNTMSGYDNVLMATAQAAAEAASLMSSIASGISFTNPETK